MPNAVCLPRNENGLSWITLGGKSGGKSKSGQQVEVRSTSHVQRPDRPCQSSPMVNPMVSLQWSWQRGTFLFSHAYAVDLFLFSVHTGDCWTSGLCAAKIAAKIKHAWLLGACPSTQLVCPLLSTTALATPHPGEARTFSERRYFFLLPNWPRQRHRGMHTPCLHRGQSLHQWFSRSLGAGCARDAGSTQHEARCRPVNHNRNFFSQFTPMTTLIRHESRPLPIFAWP